MKKIYVLLMGAVLSAGLWMSCSKKDSATPASTTTTTSSSTTSATTGSTTSSSTAGTTSSTSGSTTGTVDASSIFISGNMDGSFFQYVAGNGNLWSGTESGGLSDVSGSAKFYTGRIYDTKANKSYFRVTKGTLNFSGDRVASQSVFADFFKAGSYAYNPSDTLFQPNGIVVTYYDAQGNTWSSDHAPANQSGSTFAITSSKDDSNTSEQRLKVNATFSCKLYNSTGQSKTITNGKLSLHFLND